MKVRYSYLKQQFSNCPELWLRLKKFVITSDFTLGKELTIFERRFAKLIGTKYAVGVNSGTDALKLSLKAINIQSGDEVITCANTFVATVGAIVEVGAKPVFVDCDDTFCMDYRLIEKKITKKTKAIMPVHYTGYMPNMIEIKKISNKYKIPIIEDACQSILGSYNKKKAGTWGIAGSFSLHPLKTITSGEGGIVTTNNFKISNNIKLFRSHGILRNKKNYWNYDVVKHGYNYRLSDINCSLGLEQLTKITFFLKKRKKIYDNYRKQLKNFSPYLIIPVYSKLLKPSYHLFLIHIIFDQLGKTKEHFIKYLIKNKIFPQQHYIPIYKFTVYKKKKFFFSGSEKFFQNVLSMPIYVNLSNNHQNRVIKSIKCYLNENKKKSI